MLATIRQHLKTVITVVCLIIIIVCASRSDAASVDIIVSGTYPNCAHVDHCIAENYILVGDAIHPPPTTGGHFTIFECRHGCALHTIDLLQLFAYSPRIEQLHLSGSGILALSEHSFRAADQLSELDLSYNRLEILAASQFNGAPLLRSLRLSHNRIVRLDVEAFSGCEQLEEIFLDHNWLARFAAQLPASVEALHLQGNSIDSVTTMVTSVVRMLDVSNNALISFELADNATQLEVLNVARNQLTSLYNITTHVALTVLDISSNPIAVYPIFTFAGLHALQTLRMRDAGLRTLGHGLFGDHAHLRELDIGANRALATGTVDWTVLDRMPELRELTVTDIGLRDLGPLAQWQRFVATATGFHRLWLAGNRFNCTYLQRLAVVVQPYRLHIAAAQEQTQLTGIVSVYGVPCELIGELKFEAGGGAPATEMVLNCSALHAKLDILGDLLTEHDASATIYRRVAFVEGVVLIAIAVLVFWYVGMASWMRPKAAYGSRVSLSESL